MRKPAGLFITHVVNDRITAHFERLKAESEAFVDWQLVFNQKSVRELTDQDPSISSLLGHSRVQEARQSSWELGYIDLLLVPLAMQTDRDFVWILEYDVDFSGHWREFFKQFEENRADLLTTTLNTPDRDPDWVFWQTSVNPPDAAHLRTRSFNPIFRVSRSYLEGYCDTVSRGGWSGHSEFLISTVPRACGLTIEDIGGDGPFTPEKVRGANYLNVPAHPHLTPGTFFWRPSFPRYFHEAPDEFSCQHMLYHPVKPNVTNWDSPKESKKKLGLASMLSQIKLPFFSRGG